MEFEKLRLFNVWGRAHITYANSSEFIPLPSPVRTAYTLLRPMTPSCTLYATKWPTLPQNARRLAMYPMQAGRLLKMISRPVNSGEYPYAK